MGHRCRAGARGDRCEPSPGPPRRAERFRADALGEHLLGDLLVSGKHHLNAPDVIDHLREVVRRGEVDVLGAFQRLGGVAGGPVERFLATYSPPPAPPPARGCGGRSNVGAHGRRGAIEHVDRQHREHWPRGVASSDRVGVSVRGPSRPAGKRWRWAPACGAMTPRATCGTCACHRRP